MTPDAIVDVLREMLEEEEFQQGLITASSALAIMSKCYRDQVVDGVAENEGDMLLFQWGTYDWGDGESFTFEIARQFMYDDGTPIQQLRVTLEFATTSELQGVGSGNLWCHHRDDLDDAIAELNEQDSYLAIADMPEGDLAIDLQEV